MKAGENIFIISGPSGAGEDSVIEGLRNYFDIERVITTTTRKKRKGDSEGNPYHFISKKEFKAKIKRGEFIEYAKAYNGNFYGTTKKELERVGKSKKIGIWKIEYKGVQIIKKKLSDVKSIYIAPPDLKTLKNRIKRRSKVESNYVEERMKYTKEWLKYEKIYDYKVINHEGKLEQTVREVRDIIKKTSGNRVGVKIIFGVLVVIILAGYFMAFVFFHPNIKDIIKDSYKNISVTYEIKSKERSFEGLLKFVPKDVQLAYVVGPVTFDFFTEQNSSDIQAPTYQQTLFFYPKDDLSPGVIIELNQPKSDQWESFKQMVAQIWAKKFPSQVPLTLPDGTIVYELVPKPENVEPTVIEYKGEKIYELSNKEDSTLAYSIMGDYIIVSSSTQIVRSALLSNSDSSQRLVKDTYSRCSGNDPYQYIVANTEVDVENSDLYLDILPKNTSSAKNCI
ncbi:guanylate kinase [Patescibacteria group bacterium]|nr:guanylate kinase [Patescibacteria group bacterium]